MFAGLANPLLEDGDTGAPLMLADAEGDRGRYPESRLSCGVALVYSSLAVTGGFM
jgi:hypothetical protein